MDKEKNVKKNKVKEEVKHKKDKKEKNIKRKKIIKRILICMFIFIIICVGIFAGLIIGLSTKYAITKEDLIINYSNGKVVDQSEETIAILNGAENRKILSKNEMGTYLSDAFVCIEDKRFYSHKGVDLKRTSAAIVTFIFNRGKSSFGGSTITQQLVKNITNEKEDSGTAGAIRKIKEMVRAYQVEKILSKDQILELYMNLIYLGGNVYGVGMASEYYFSKTPQELDLAESAFIAGVTHSPNTYNPFVSEPNTDKIKSRTKTVLLEMKKNNKISNEDYENAIKKVEEGLQFKKGSISNKASYSSHTEALISNAIEQLVTEKGMDRKYAETYLYSSGLTIYSTEVKNIQDKLEEEYSNSKYQVETTVSKVVDGETVKVKEKSQSAMVIIEPSTGYVVGSIGCLGEREAFSLNRATQSTRQPGSSIKPIGVYGPALQEGIITASSVYDDVPIQYGNYTPHNSYSGYKGLSNMRQAMRLSQNTVAVEVLADLSPEKAINYLRNLGISSLNDESDNNLSLALGGISYGISPLEMAAAYAAIANDGEYISPTYYTKIEDLDGNIILEVKQTKKEVFSEQNAYILKQLLKEPTHGGGTASSCIISGMDTAGKTGTTNSNKDKWLCGFTSYYAAATWYGFDTPTAVPGSASSNASKLWKSVMSSIHKDLEAKRFEKPDKIVTATVCKDSGLLATDICKNDTRGNRTYTEYFVKGTVPSKTCTCHVETNICTVSNKVAGDNCINTEKKIYITRTTDYDKWKRAADAEYTLHETETCTNCLADTNAPVITLNGDNTINLHIGNTYTELGAKAVDDKDGDVSTKIIVKGSVNTNVVGTYTITYTVSDTAGNISEVTRTVNVQEKEKETKKETEKETKKENTNNETDKQIEKETNNKLNIENNT